jgi:hypothetical protein
LFAREKQIAMGSLVELGRLPQRQHQAGSGMRVEPEQQVSQFVRDDVTQQFPGRDHSCRFRRLQSPEIHDRVVSRPVGILKGLRKSIL